MPPPRPGQGELASPRAVGHGMACARRGRRPGRRLGSRMASHSVLFIGGTGVISSACVAESVARGLGRHDPQPGHQHHASGPPRRRGADRRTCATPQPCATPSASASSTWSWTSCRSPPTRCSNSSTSSPTRTGQYVFISSASAYQTPPARLPVTESTPLRNPFWQYSRDKIACEDLLVAAYRDDDLPMTIVRPSHTYDHTLPPFEGRWTVVERMRQGKEVVVHGDGTSLWTITHHTDFARAFVGLLGRREAIGEAFHITGDEAPAWNRIYADIAEAAGRRAAPRARAVGRHRRRRRGVRRQPAGRQGALDGLRQQQDPHARARLEAVVPFRQGAQEIVDWHDADPARRVVDADLDALYDRLVSVPRRPASDRRLDGLERRPPGGPRSAQRRRLGSPPWTGTSCARGSSAGSGDVAMGAPAVTVALVAARPRGRRCRRSGRCCGSS